MSQDLTPMIEALGRIEARIARLEDAVAPAQALAHQAPAMVATVVDSVDGHLAALGDADARVTAALALLNHLTRPDTLATLERLLDALPALAHAAGLAKDAPGFVAAALDSVDGVMGRVVDAGIDPHQVGAAALDVSAAVARALVETRAAKPAPVGAFGALSALSDPEVQAALGFLVTFARRFGAHLPR